MPTYVYKFVDTGETIEVQQAFTDDALTEFPPSVRWCSARREEGVPASGGHVQGRWLLQDRLPRRLVIQHVLDVDDCGDDNLFDRVLDVDEHQLVGLDVSASLTPAPTARRLRAELGTPRSRRTTTCESVASGPTLRTNPTTPR